jgi:hypothetical protein
LRSREGNGLPVGEAGLRAAHGVRLRPKSVCQFVPSGVWMIGEKIGRKIGMDIADRHYFSF